MMVYKREFIPYAFAAPLIGLVDGFSTVLWPAFVKDVGIVYNNTIWASLAQAISTAACAPILSKVGDVIGCRKALLLGVAVFVPFFTNQITGTIAADTAEASAAVASTHSLAVAEILCIALGIIGIAFLLKHKVTKENSYAVKR